MCCRTGHRQDVSYWMPACLSPRVTKPCVTGLTECSFMFLEYYITHRKVHFSCFFHNYTMLSEMCILSIILQPFEGIIKFLIISNFPNKSVIMLPLLGQPAIISNFRFRKYGPGYLRTTDTWWVNGRRTVLFGQDCPHRNTRG